MAVSTAFRSGQIDVRVVPPARTAARAARPSMHDGPQFAQSCTEVRSEEAGCTRHQDRAARERAPEFVLPAIARA